MKESGTRGPLYRLGLLALICTASASVVPACESRFTTSQDRTAPEPPVVHGERPIVFERYLAGRVGTSTVAFAQLRVPPLALEPDLRMRVYPGSFESCDDEPIVEFGVRPQAQAVIGPLNLSDAEHAVWVSLVDAAGNESSRRLVREGRLIASATGASTRVVALTRVGARDASLFFDETSGAYELTASERDLVATQDGRSLRISPIRSWHPVAPATELTVESGAPGFSAAFDRSRGRAIVFGDFQELRPSVLEFDGSRWHAVEVSFPVPVWYGAMSYEASRSRTLMYGGRLPARIVDSEPCPDRLWAWDGRRWEEVVTERGPGCVEGHSMVYDEARDRTLLFGGVDGTGSDAVPHDHLWSFDGSDWRRIDPVPNWPAARFRHAMAFDPEHQDVVVVGGCADWRCKPTADAASTWVWNGDRWESFRSDVHPPIAPFGQLVYVPRLGGLLYLGRGIEQGAPHEVWLWRGRKWTRLEGGLVPPVHHTAYQLLHSASDDALLLLGSGQARYPGTSDETSRVAIDVWSHRRDRWLPRRISGERPAGRGEATAAYDPERGTVVLYGGATHEVAFSDTWALLGWRWSRLADAPPELGSRTGAAMAYLPWMHGLALVGGHRSADSMPSGDLWRLTEDGWQRQLAVDPRLARKNHLFVAEPEVDSAIVVGDRDRILEHVRLNPALNWVDLGDDGPTNRGGQAGALDAFNGCVWVFGGHEHIPMAANSDDLWCWNGMSWRRVAKRDPWPAARTAAAMTYDPIRRRTLLFGGERTIDGVPERGHEWDGEQWHELAVEGPRPRDVSSHVLVYDEASEAVVLFGGYDVRAAGPQQVFSDETWILPSHDAGPALRIAVAWPVLASATSVRSVGIDVMMADAEAPWSAELWIQHRGSWSPIDRDSGGTRASHLLSEETYTEDMFLRLHDGRRGGVGRDLEIDRFEVELRYVVAPASEKCVPAQ